MARLREVITYLYSPGGMVWIHRASVSAALYDIVKIGEPLVTDGYITLYQTPSLGSSLPSWRFSPWWTGKREMAPCNSPRHFAAYCRANPRES